MLEFNMAEKLQKLIFPVIITFLMHDSFVSYSYYCQVCGFSGSNPNWKNFVDRQSVCGLLICRRWVIEKYVLHATSLIDICSKKVYCTNFPDLEKIGCSTLSETESIICNGFCDKPWCVDESECNGFKYGIFCQPFSVYLPPSSVCDGAKQCNTYHEDEKYCQRALDEGFPSCLNGEIRRPLFNFTRCAAINMVLSNELQPYCSNYIDQTNCTDPSKVGLMCYIQDYGLSTVSKFMVCGELRVGLCANKMDVQCVSPSLGCTVHKHQLCNGVNDCPHSSDELLAVCQTKTKKHCYRSYKHDYELAIPISWLADGITDCTNGIDEDSSLWPTCGKAETKRYIMENSVCRDLFLCRYGTVRFIIESQLCDGINTCGNENKICRISRGVFSVSTTVLKDEYSTRLHYCIKGLEDLQRQQSPCETKIFDYFQEDIYGVSKKTHPITYPQKTFDCRNFFGLAYLYLSCFGACKNSKCPLTRAVRYADCQGQFNDRVYTLVNNQYLTFVTRKAGIYTNDFFTCENGFCVEYRRICNLIDDCGDGSDESICVNHHRCGDNRSYISLAQKCDNKVNCEDWSDECNDQCGRQIINGLVLKFAAWSIGLLAVVSNVVVLSESTSEVRKANGKSLLLIDKILVMMIGLGDLFIGLYLLSVSVVDIIYGESYCKERVKWLTSGYCSALGVISTIGGQISLFSLTLLSLFRAIGVSVNRIRSNESNGKAPHFKIVHVLKIVLLLVVPLVAVTTLIATAPLFPLFEDFFVNGLAYDSTVKLFTEPIGKDTHFDVIQGYFGRAKNQTLKWSLIINLVRNMFSSDYGNLDRKVHKVDFYGNDGVCLFKYFVNYDDPQRIYSLSVQVFNILCFIIVAVSYIIINTTTVNNSNILTQGNNPNAKFVRKRNVKLQRKITAIIVTDFACWIPFVVVSFLHFFKVLDASRTYGVFSIVILPINSIINPLFYSSRVSAYAAKLNPGALVRKLPGFIIRIRIRNFWKQQKMNQDERQTSRVVDNNTCNDLPMQVMAPNCEENQEKATIQVTPS